MIKCGDIQISLILEILKDSASELKGTINYTSDNSTKHIFSTSFFKQINTNLKEGVRFLDRDNKECAILKLDENGNLNDLEDNSEWALGEFSIFLSK